MIFRMTDARRAKLEKIIAKAWRRGEAVSLAGEDLSWADLNGLDLSGVDLRGADLSGAEVEGVNFDEAIVKDARFLQRAFAAAPVSLAPRAPGETPSPDARSPLRPS